LRAALAWSLESSNSASALRLTGAAFWFWSIRGYWSEGQKWLDDALAHADRERGRKAELITPDANHVRNELAQRARVVYGAGLLRYAMVTDLTVAHTRMEESL